jgi:hypothetical protein
MNLRLLALSLILPAAVAVGAQTERVTVHMAPAPNQTLHLRTTQDMEMTTEMDPSALSGGSVPALVNLHTVLDTTSAIGPGVAMGVAGETQYTQYTLTSVTFDGADRIAHLTSHTTSTMSQAPSPVPAGPAVAFDMTMTSNGKSDVNVDRGIVLHAEQRSTIEGTMHAGAAGQAMPNMQVHGTFTIVSDLVK